MDIEFIGREWLFKYIYDDKNKKILNKTICITGDHGTGKSFICDELLLNRSSCMKKISRVNKTLLLHKFTDSPNKGYEKFLQRLIKAIEFEFPDSFINSNSKSSRDSKDYELELYKKFELLKNCSNLLNYTIVIDSVENCNKIDSLITLLNNLNEFFASLV